MPKLNKSVILLSTDRHDDAIEDEYKHKPVIILDYNRCKGKLSIEAFKTKLILINYLKKVVSIHLII